MGSDSLRLPRDLLLAAWSAVGCWIFLARHVPTMEQPDLSMWVEPDPSNGSGLSNGTGAACKAAVGKVAGAM